MKYKRKPTKAEREQNRVFADWLIKEMHRKMREEEGRESRNRQPAYLES